MNSIVPSLAAFLGERVAAYPAGSLTTLSKYFTPTVLIFGAKKALFRGLKTKGNTRKVRSSFP